MTQYIRHFDQFTNITFVQGAESFLFGLLSQSLNLRQSFQLMESADDGNKQAVVAKEFTKVVMASIFFDNIYYSGLDVLESGEIDQAFEEVAEGVGTFLVRASSSIVYKY